MISFVPALATVSSRCLRSAAALCGGPSSGRIPLTPVDGGHKRKCSGKSASGANEVKGSSHRAKDGDIQSTGHHGHDPGEDVCSGR